MIDKTAGLPTQIRQLERRLKDMDVSKIKPALVHEITETIKNLKQLLKEKQEKREQRKKNKEQKSQEVEKEAINIPNATDVGTTTTTTPAPGASTAPTTPQTDDAPSNAPDDASPQCQLCGGLVFADYAGYQNHMEFTHASDVMPTTPGQKEDKLVASVETEAVASPKCAICGTQFNSFPEYQQHRDQAHSQAPAKEKVMSEQATGPQFKLDDNVKPIRGGESTGKVMRWDGKPSDLVYVAWDSGPLAERDTFGGYYPKDLQLVQEEQPVEAAMPQAEPICKSCESMKQKHGDLKTNYEALLKDLQDERDIHYTQGNNAWVARLDQKIVDLKKSMEEKFGIEPQGCSTCGQKKEAGGGPELIRQINRATSGHGYEATVYDLTNGRFQQNVPLKINDTNVRMKQPENGTFELKYSGMPEWRPVLQPEFDQWLAQWKEINQKNNQKEGGAQNAEELTIMDHTPPRANKTMDEGGTDSKDEFQDEWAMPVTSAQKISVFNKEFTATPVNGQKAFAGYDISQDGKKLFNIKAKNSQPMNKKQLQFCTEIELTRGLKQAKLVEKIAFLEAGSKVYIVVENKAQKRVKFASMDQGLRGWAPASKFAFLIKEGEMRKHQDHIDNTYGNNGKEVLCDCPNGSGNMVWLPMGELLPIQRPPATPESLNDLESKAVCPKCKGQGIPGHGSCPECGGYATEMKERKQADVGMFPDSYFRYAAAKDRAEQFGLIDVEDSDLTPAGLAAKKQEMIEGHDVEAAKKTADQGTCGECGQKGYISTYTDKQGREFDLCQEHYQHARDKKAAKECQQCGGKMLKTDVDFCSEECRDDNEKQEKRGAKDCPDCHGNFVGNEGETCPTCGRFAVQKTAGSSTLTPGTRIRISDGSGISSGAEGTITTRREFNSNVQTNEHGVPNVGGAYKPVDWSREVPIKLDDGSYMTMFKNRVIPVEQKTALETALPKQILPQRGDVNEMNPSNGPSDEDVQQKAWELFKQHWDGLSSEQMDEVYQALGVTSSLKIAEYKDKGIGEFECFECGKRFVSKGKLDDHMDASKHKSPKKASSNESEIGKYKCIECGQAFDTQFSLNNHVYDETFKKASLNKIARVVHREDGWHVLSEKGKNLGGPYKTKEEAVKRLRQVEYFKHHGSLKPFSKKADALTDHITDMKGRMTEVQEKLQNAPAVKTAEGDKVSARPDPDDLSNPDNPDYQEDHDLMDSFVQLSNGSFALVQSHDEGGMIEVDILGKTEKGYKYVTDSPIPVPVSAVKRELDWDEIQALNIEHEPWPPVTSEVKQADQVTDETETLVSNDPAVVNSFTPDATTAPTFQNVQPTDNDNLEIPVAKPTSPPAPGQVWVFNPDDGVYVSMPDPANPGKTI